MGSALNVVDCLSRKSQHESSSGAGIEQDTRQCWLALVTEVGDSFLLSKRLFVFWWAA